MAATLIVGFARSASAEPIVTTSGKGIVGGALLGAETVVLVESVLGVHSSWAHFGGAVGGAIGGGVGGYFIEQIATDGRIPLTMLAGGLVLAIPTVVISLNATSYRAVEPPGEAPPPAVVGLRDGTFRAGLPVPNVSNVFSPSELRQYGMAQRAQVQLPLLHVRF